MWPLQQQPQVCFFLNNYREQASCQEGVIYGMHAHAHTQYLAFCVVVSARWQQPRWAPAVWRFPGSSSNAAGRRSDARGGSRSPPGDSPPPPSLEEETGNRSKTTPTKHKKIFHVAHSRNNHCDNVEVWRSYFSRHVLGCYGGLIYGNKHGWKWNKFPPN